MSFLQIVPNGVPPSDPAAENVAVAAARSGVRLAGEVQP